MIKFSSVRSALHYTVMELIPSEHGYIINIEGSDTEYPRLQVVAQGMIDGSDSNGLSVHLPFDIDSGQHENHLRFLELELAAAVHRKDVDGIHASMPTLEQTTNTPIE